MILRNQTKMAKRVRVEVGSRGSSSQRERKEREYVKETSRINRSRVEGCCCLME